MSQRETDRSPPEPAGSAGCLSRGLGWVRLPSVVSHHVAAAADSQGVGDQRGAAVGVILVGALYRSVEKLQLALQGRSSLLRCNRLDVLERRAKGTRDLRRPRTGETDLIE